MVQRLKTNICNKDKKRNANKIKAIQLISVLEASWV